MDKGKDKGMLPGWVTVVVDLRQRHIEAWGRTREAYKEDVEPFRESDPFVTICIFNDRALECGVIVIEGDNELGDLYTEQTEVLADLVYESISSVLGIETSKKKS